NAQYGGVSIDSRNSDSAEVVSNTIVSNAGVGIYITFSAGIHHNTLYNNKPVDVKVGYSRDIDGTNNYWGTVESVNIIRQIYDRFDDSNLGRFNYIPYLQEPSADTPVAPTTNLKIIIDKDL